MANMFYATVNVESLGLENEEVIVVYGVFGKNMSATMWSPAEYAEIDIRDVYLWRDGRKVHLDAGDFTTPEWDALVEQAYAEASA